MKPPRLFSFDFLFFISFAIAGSRVTQSARKAKRIRSGSSRVAIGSIRLCHAAESATFLNIRVHACLNRVRRRAGIVTHLAMDLGLALITDARVGMVYVTRTRRFYSTSQLPAIKRASEEELAQVCGFRAPASLLVSLSLSLSLSLFLWL